MFRTPMGQFFRVAIARIKLEGKEEWKAGALLYLARKHLWDISMVLLHIHL